MIRNVDGVDQGGGVLRVETGVSWIGTVVEQVLLSVGAQDIGVAGREGGLYVLVPGQGRVGLGDELPGGEDLSRGGRCGRPVHPHVGETIG